MRLTEVTLPLLFMSIRKCLKLCWNSHHAGHKFARRWYSISMYTCSTNMLNWTIVIIEFYTNNSNIEFAFTKTKRSLSKYIGLFVIFRTRCANIFQYLFRLLQLLSNAHSFRWKTNAIINWILAKIVHNVLCWVTLT